MSEENNPLSQPLPLAKSNSSISPHEEDSETLPVESVSRRLVNALIKTSHTRLRTGSFGTALTRPPSSMNSEEHKQTVAVDDESVMNTVVSDRGDVVDSDSFVDEGQEFGMSQRYTDLGILGTGGMGVVRRVRDNLLNRTLAMKILKADRTEKEATVERFIQEAQVCSQLQHPNIMPIYDLGTLDTGHMFMTMAELQGSSLDVFIERVHKASSSAGWDEAFGGWNLHRLVRVFQNVCHGVAHAHQKKVLHRDLKPQNIMVHESGETLVVDWGLAKVLGSAEQQGDVVTHRSEENAHATMAGGIFGTPIFLAPELLPPNAEDASPKSDIYSLGVILYEILRGSPPYEGKTALEVLLKVAKSPPQPFEFTTVSSSHSNQENENSQRIYLNSRGAPLPSALVEICNTAMSRNPKVRYDSVSELVTLIGQWLDGSQRREKALSLVRQGHGLTYSIDDLSDEATDLRQKAIQAQREIPTWASDEQKFQFWEIEDRASNLEAQAVVYHTRRAQLFRNALAHKHDLVEAHTALAEHYRAVHEEAEIAGDTIEAQRSEVLLREHVALLPKGIPTAKNLRNYLEGTGYLSVFSQPAGAEIRLAKLLPQRRRLQPDREESIGHTPLEEKTVDRGSYLVKLRKEGYHEARVPIFNQRQDIIDGTNPEGEIAPVRLLPQGTLGHQDCYVPAGWCFVGGDHQTPNSGPRRRIWLEGFVIQKFPVTHEAYLVFLNDLVSNGRADEALLHVPREQSSSDEELGLMAYRQDPQGYFSLPTDPLRETCHPKQPVTMIQWRTARAYADWLSQKSGLPWRLPMEFEWEKAARGVDGRSYPWGDEFDPSWACMKDSHEDSVRMQSVDTFPADESVYGVRGTAGNTRDWCLDKFRDDGPPLDNCRLIMPSEKDLADPGFKSTRGGSYGNSASRARSADRDWWFPDRSYVGRGMRLVWAINDYDFGD